MEDWPGAKQFTNSLKPSLTLKQLKVLREFYMVQQALAQELQEAKPLGICKMHGLTSQIGSSVVLTDTKEEKVT